MKNKKNILNKVATSVVIGGTSTALVLTTTISENNNFQRKPSNKLKIIPNTKTDIRMTDAEVASKNSKISKHGFEFSGGGSARLTNGYETSSWAKSRLPSSIGTQEINMIFGDSLIFDPGGGSWVHSVNNARWTEYNDSEGWIKVVVNFTLKNNQYGDSNVDRWILLRGMNYDLDGDGTGDYNKSTSLNLTDISASSNIKEIFANQIQISDSKAPNYVDRYVSVNETNSWAQTPARWELTPMNNNLLVIKSIFPVSFVNGLVTNRPLSKEVVIGNIGSNVNTSFEILQKNTIEANDYIQGFLPSDLMEGIKPFDVDKILIVDKIIHLPPDSKRNYFFSDAKDDKGTVVLNVGYDVIYSNGVLNNNNNVTKSLTINTNNKNIDLDGDGTGDYGKNTKFEINEKPGVSLYKQEKSPYFFKENTDDILDILNIPTSNLAYELKNGDYWPVTPRLTIIEANNELGTLKLIYSLDMYFETIGNNTYLKKEPIAKEIIIDGFAKTQPIKDNETPFKYLTNNNNIGVTSIDLSIIKAGDESMIANNIVNNLNLLGSYIKIVGNNIPLNAIMTHAINANDSKGQIEFTITFSQSFVNGTLTEDTISKTIIVGGFAKIGGGLLTDNLGKPVESQIYVKPYNEIGEKDIQNLMESFPEQSFLPNDLIKLDSQSLKNIFLSPIQKSDVNPLVYLVNIPDSLIIFNAEIASSNKGEKYIKITITSNKIINNGVIEEKIIENYLNLSLGLLPKPYNWTPIIILSTLGGVFIIAVTVFLIVNGHLRKKREDEMYENEMFLDEYELENIEFDDQEEILYLEEEN